MGSEARKEELAKKSLENGNRMAELGSTALRISVQQEAHMKLYNVFAETGDEDSMAKERQILHDLLDQMCDVGSQIGVGMREASKIAKEFIQLT